MARCPNCGLETARTLDWACQWCGHPLLSGPYKKVDKTFRELKEERESQYPVEEVRPEPPPRVRPEPPVKPKPAAAQQVTPEAETTAKTVPQAPATAPPKAVSKPQVAPEAKPEPTPQPQPAPEAKPEPTPAIVITVADLLSAYETEGPAADARFAGKVLKITGVIDKINVKTALDIYQLYLNSPKKGVLLQGVRCVFDRQFGPQLSKLATGQTITVQGKYDGSIIDISLRDCFLVP
jgi:hypothetical protein